MTGDRLARTLIQVRAGIPIVLCTGHSDRISEEEATRIGVKAYIKTPYMENELAAAIREVLDRTKEELLKAVKDLLG